MRPDKLLAGKQQKAGIMSCKISSLSADLPALYETEHARWQRSKVQKDRIWGQVISTQESKCRLKRLPSDIPWSDYVSAAGSGTK